MEEQVLSGDVKVCKGKSFSDSRGHFIKLFDNGLPSLEGYRVKQANYVVNPGKYIFRGLHYQLGEFSESKIFRVLSGSIQLVFFDTRPASRNFKKSSDIVLDDPGFYVHLPRGYATGYCTLEENTHVLYFSDNVYSVENERGIRYNDPVLRLSWPTTSLIISDKDLNWPDFIF